MLKISSSIGLVLVLLVAITGVNAAPMYKCIVNGTVTYQQDPCPIGQVRKPPSVQELNAAEKKRPEFVTTTTPDKNAITQDKAPVNPQRPEKSTPTASNPAPASTLPSSFSCDGRKRCTQMKSCAEAKYFLANCPGVKMDGDKDGTPCEKQWCTR